MIKQKQKKLQGCIDDKRHYSIQRRKSSFPVIIDFVWSAVTHAWSFLWYLCHFRSFENIISPLNSAIFFLCRIGWIKWISATQNFGVWGSPIWSCWYLVGWDPKRNLFEVYAFHRYHWFVENLDISAEFLPLLNPAYRTIRLIFC